MFSSILAATQEFPWKDLIPGAADLIRDGAIIVGLIGAAYAYIKAKLVTPISQVLHEVTPNGGGSIKDLVIDLKKDTQLSVALLDAMANALEYGVWRSDPAGEWVSVNEKLTELTGRAPQDLIGNGWRGCVAPLFKHDVLEEWDAAVEEKRHFSANFSYIRNDGTMTPVYAVKAVPVLDNGGHLWMMVGIVKPPKG